VTRDEVHRVQGDIVSLREHLESMLAAQKMLFESQLDAIIKTVEQHAKLTSEKFESVNYIRATLTDQNSTFARTDKVDALASKNDSDMRALRREIIDSVVGKLETNLAGFAKELDTIKSFMNQMQGKASQSSVNWAYLIAAVSMILTIMKFFIK